MNDAEFAAVEQSLRSLVMAQGMMKHLGAQIDEITPGRTVLSLEQRPEVLQQHGFFHGGAMAFLIDTGTTTAAGTLADRNTQSVLTAEYKLNFLSPARGRRITCESVVVRPGRKLSVVEAKVYSHENGAAKIVAVALATIAVVDRIPSLP